MKVAIIYDHINKMGGAERVLLALHELWPDAPIFTAVYDKRGATWADNMDVRPTWLNHIPFAKNHHEFFPWLTPCAIESMDLRGYDIVISVTSSDAKAVITGPDTLHVCYCLTPTRYLWSGRDQYEKRPGFGMLDGISLWFLSRIRPALETWDKIASTRPDRYIAISHHVEQRIKKYYGRDTDTVIYPPVDCDTFVPRKGTRTGSGYLFVSRLVPYKRADLVVDAFNDLGLPLTIIGEGNQKRRLMHRANANIHFVSGHLTDTELARYYQTCRAFIFPGDEDFGIVAAEAQACGKPVIAYRDSGIAEIVQDGRTGILFDVQSKDAVETAVLQSQKTVFDMKACRKNAERFTKEVFKKKFYSYINRTYKNVYNI